MSANEQNSAVMEATGREAVDAAAIDAEIAAMEAQAEESAAKAEAAVAEPAPKPTVAKETPAAEKQKAVETPKAAEPKSETPAQEPTESEHNRAMAAQRHKQEQLERERDEWRQKAEAAERERSQPQAPKQPAIDPLTVFDNLARANREEFVNPGQNEQVKRQASAYILDHMTSAEVAQVHRDALRGAYGTASGEIADLTSRYLPAIQSREFQQAETQRAQQTQQRQAFDQELAEAAAKFKPFTDANTDEGKLLQALEAEYLGKEAHALPPQVQQFVKGHPMIRAQIASAAHKLVQAAVATVQSENTKLKQQVADYEKKLNLRAAPASPSPAVSGEPTGGETVEEMEARLEAMTS